MNHPATNPLTPVSEMTDRELLEEIVLNNRMVMEVVESLGNNPMISAIASGQNPMLAMIQNRG